MKEKPVVQINTKDTSEWEKEAQRIRLEEAVKNARYFDADGNILDSKGIKDDQITFLEQRLKETEAKYDLMVSEYNLLCETNKELKEERSLLRKGYHSEDAINRIKAEYFEKGLKANNLKEE